MDPLRKALEELAKTGAAPVTPVPAVRSDQSVSLMLIKVAGVLETNPTRELLHDLPQILKEAAACITDLKTKLASGDKARVINDITTRLREYSDMGSQELDARRAEYEDMSMEKLSGIQQGLSAAGTPDMRMFEVSEPKMTPSVNTEDDATLRLGSALSSIVSQDQGITF